MESRGTQGQAQVRATSTTPQGVGGGAHLTQGLILGGDRSDAVGQLLDLSGFEAQPVHQLIVDLALRRVHVCIVLLHYLLLALLEDISHLEQDGLTLLQQMELVLMFTWYCRDRFQ